MKQQLNAWIFENLLECSPQYAARVDWVFGGVATAAAAAHESEQANEQANRQVNEEGTNENDGLLVSPGPRNVIQLEPQSEWAQPTGAPSDNLSSFNPVPRADWLSQPLSGRSLAWTVDSLMVFAALLLFSLVFLSVNQELPRWPLAMATGAVVFVSAFYWMFFRIFAGVSLGGRLARLAASEAEDAEEARDAARFR
jgi:hypothetical protein